MGCFVSRRGVFTTVPESTLSGENKSLNRLERTESIYKLGKHRSNALDLIQQVPSIKVDGDVAVCDGGGGALGHPLEYIKVGFRGGKPVSCIYCGLRYRSGDSVPLAQQQAEGSQNK